MNKYQSVINDVISNVRESFLDEGVDENVLIELKNLWQQKLEASKAVENTTTHNDTSVLGNFTYFPLKRSRRAKVCCNPRLFMHINRQF